MKGFTRFAMRVTILLTFLEAVSWILYYLMLYVYLPKNETTQSLHALITILLTVLPILNLLLLFSLLLVKKPKFQKLHTSLTVYLCLIFILNFLVSIYDSHNHLITTKAMVSDFGKTTNAGYVVVITPEKTLRLSCRKEFYSLLSPNTSYTIQYITNDLFEPLDPSIIQIETIE